jgi:hypothetical protein
MKSQSLKLFAMAFVLGLVAVFSSVSASAQSRLFFEAPFDFHVGADKLAAGKYQLYKMDYGKYLLKNVETEKSRIVLFDVALSNSDEKADERIVFNRYGETYFLRALFAKPGVLGNQIIESKFEKQIRKGSADRQNQLAGEKAKPEQISVKVTK